jgi:O-antigen ligase
LWLPFSVFSALTLLSALLSDDPLRSLKDARQLFQILIFYLAVHAVRDDREAVWLARALIAATSAAALYTLGIAMTRQIDLANRMSGFFSIYMTLAGFLVVVGSLALAHIVLSGGRRRGWWVQGAGLLILAALMSTFSRNAWVGIAAAALFVVIAARNWKWAAGLTAIAVAAVLLSPGAVQERVRSVLNPKDTTARERILMWRSGLRMAADRPFSGFGLDMIKRSYTRYADPRALKKWTGHLHNNLLHIAVERGLPALVAWVWIWVAFFGAGYRRRKFFRDMSFERQFLTVGGFAAITGFLAAGLFEYNFGDSEVVMTAYFAMALPFMGGGREEALTEA